MMNRRASRPVHGLAALFAFGRGVVHTVIGTAVGGTIGLLASGLNSMTAVIGAPGGFVGAAVLRRFRNPKGVRSEE